MSPPQPGWQRTSFLLSEIQCKQQSIYNVNFPTRISTQGQVSNPIAQDKRVGGDQIHFFCCLIPHSWDDLVISHQVLHPRTVVQGNSVSNTMFWRDTAKPQEFITTSYNQHAHRQNKQACDQDTFLETLISNIVSVLNSELSVCPLRPSTHRSQCALCCTRRDNLFGTFPSLRDVSI